MFAQIVLTCFMLIGFESLVKSEETELVMLQVIFRHAERTPVSSYPRDPNSPTFWDQFGGLQELTPNGIRQAYRYGNFLRKRYDDFLSLRYNENQVIIKSTNISRAIKTAQSIVSTLYKPRNANYWDEQLAPLPTPWTNLRSLWNMDNKCSKYDQLMAQILKSDEFFEVNSYYKDTIEDADLNSGIVNNNLFTLCGIDDIVYLEKSYNLTLPDWAEDNFDKLQKSCDDSYHFMYRTPEMAKLITGRILKDINMNIKRKVSGRLGQIELVMYSGHDTLVAPLIKQLELMKNVTKPKFMASFILELRRAKENGKSKYYVQALLNDNEPEEAINLRKVNIAGCDLLCPLEDFEKILSNKIVKDYAKECAADISNVSLLV